MDAIAQDRRECSRYPLELKVRYRLIRGMRTTWSGVGHTTDFNRRAIRFVTPRKLPLDHRVELLIDWPVRFAEMYPMELCVAATIVRSEEGIAVARMTSWQFRVAANAAESECEAVEASLEPARDEVAAPVFPLM